MKLHETTFDKLSDSGGVVDPVCHRPMRRIGIIDDPHVIEQILRHLGAGTTGQLTPPPQGGPGSAYASCDDADSTPDYENVLTD